MESTHHYRIEPINWSGREMNAVVIADLTRENIEEGLVAVVLANRILAENLDVSAPPAKWAVFAKPYNMRTEWRLLGSGFGTHALPEDQAPSGDIPECIIRQLEEISWT
jgi:hypothetical protein